MPETNSDRFTVKIKCDVDLRIRGGLRGPHTFERSELVRICEIAFEHNNGMLEVGFDHVRSAVASYITVDTVTLTAQALPTKQSLALTRYLFSLPADVPVGVSLCMSVGDLANVVDLSDENTLDVLLNLIHKHHSRLSDMLPEVRSTVAELSPESCHYLEIASLL